MIRSKGVDFSREIPLLDSHSLRNQPLGHVAEAWVTTNPLDGDALLMARLRFDDTRAGRRAYDIVVCEELTGVSGGFHIGSVSVHDADGTALEVEKALERQEDPSLFFYVQRSILQEVSLCSMPADPNAIVRACGLDAECWRMIRQGEATLRRNFHPEYDRDDDDDELMRRVLVPGRETILYGAPELLNSIPTMTRAVPLDDDPRRTGRFLAGAGPGRRMASPW